MKILLLDTKPSNPNAYLTQAVYAAFARHPAVERVALVEYRDAIATATREAFDVFFVFGGEEANNAVTARLADLVPVRSVWFTEDPYELPTNLKVCDRFDVVFTNDRECAGRYPVPAHHLPLAAAPEINLFEAGTLPLRYDLFFAGTAWPNRLQFLRDLRHHLPDLKMKLELVTNPVLDSYITNLRDGFTFTNGVSIRNFSAFSGASAVTLVLPRRFSTSDKPDAGSETPGPRLFEAAAAGACQLIDTRSLPIANELYRSGEDFVGFETLEECVAGIRRLVGDRQARDAIAHAARERTRGEHLYDHRIARIVEELAPLVAEKRAPRAASLTATPRRVLFLAHNILQHGHFGGSEVYLDEIRTSLGRYEPYFLVHDQRGESGRFYQLLDRDLKVIERLEIRPSFIGAVLTRPELEAFLQQQIARLGIDIVHINHSIGQPFSQSIVAKAWGAKVVYTLHDYFPLCDNFNLVGHDGQFCRIDERPETTCDVCRLKSAGLAPGSMARRRRFSREAMEAVDLVIAGSQASADIFTTLMPHVRDRMDLMPPPVVWKGREGTPGAIGTDGLQVAFLGNFAEHKGAVTALEVFRAFRGRKVHFHLFGRVDGMLESRLREHLDHNVTAHGMYPTGELPEAFYGCHAVLLLSTWPETYCMTLSESFAAGVVPVVTRVGALAERVRDGVDGFIVPIGQAEPIVAALSRLLDEPGLHTAMRDARPADPFVSVPAYVSWLEERYDALLAGVPPRAPVTDAARTFSLAELGVHLNHGAWPAPSGMLAPPPVPGSMPVMTGSLLSRFLQVRRSQGLGTALRMARQKVINVVRTRLYYARLR